jgi:hypothetical protein
MARKKDCNIGILYPDGDFDIRFNWDKHEGLIREILPKMQEKEREIGKGRRYFFLRFKTPRLRSTTHG